MLKRFLAILRARNREFIRDRSALAWNIILPVFIITGFAFAFSEESATPYKIGIYGTANAQTESHLQDFLQTRYVKHIKIKNLEPAIVKVERHQLDMLIDVSTPRYWINNTSQRGYILERILLGSLAEGDRAHLSKQEITGREIRYVDWVIPGVLGMNMMFSALFGVGYVIVRYRKNGVLKRLHATPLTALEFLSAQVVSRLWLILSITIVIFLGTHFFIGFAMFGNYFDLLIVFTLGAISMITLGLVVAARIASEELAGGFLNLLSWPMMFLSGVWFSLEGAHPLVQKLALIFPLTHMVSAARAIMIDGAALFDVSSQLLVLVVMSVVFLAICSYSFRWE